MIAAYKVSCSANQPESKSSKQPSLLGKTSVQCYKRFLGIFQKSSNWKHCWPTPALLIRVSSNRQKSVHILDTAGCWYADEPHSLKLVLWIIDEQSMRARLLYFCFWKALELWFQGPSSSTESSARVCTVWLSYSLISTVLVAFFDVCCSIAPCFLY